tara:strand:- start:53 stop:226 length:174 start_codon:yes stop_codon:yes gene_type:complete
MTYKELLSKSVCARVAAYPSVYEQLDMQWHDKVNGTTTWEDAINAVKVKFPKPDGEG